MCIFYATVGLLINHKCDWMNECILLINNWLYDYENVQCQCVLLNELMLLSNTLTRSSASFWHRYGIGCHVQQLKGSGTTFQYTNILSMGSMKKPLTCYIDVILRI